MSYRYMARASALALLQHGKPLRPAKPIDLSGKLAVITGAAEASLGFYVARTLALWGADVVITSRRDADRIVKALRKRVYQDASPLGVEKGNVYGYPLDLASEASVQEFVLDVLQHHGGRLDMLINNAGIHQDLLSDWREPQLTADRCEVHWRVNYLGHFHLTQLLMPALLKAGDITGDARVVNVVSELYTLGRNEWLESGPQPYNSWCAYGLSKLALIHNSCEINRLFAQQGVRGYALHPGAVATNIADDGLAERPRLQRFKRRFSALERRYLMSIQEGAQSHLVCATAPDAEPGYYERGMLVPLQPEALDTAVASALWERSTAWVAGLDAAPCIAARHSDEAAELAMAGLEAH